jgi:hypothetical protein
VDKYEARVANKAGGWITSHHPSRKSAEKWIDETRAAQGGGLGQIVELAAAALKPAKGHAPKAYEAVLDEHRARLDRLVDRRGVARMKKVYDEAYREVEARLRAVLRSGMKDSFTAYQRQVALAQIKQGQVLLARKLSGELGDISREAQTEAIEAFAKDLRKLEKTFTGAAVPLRIDEAVKLQTLVQKRRPELDDMHRKSMARWGTRLFEDVHDQLTLSLVAGETTEEAIARIPEVAAAEWWQGERIVRTETAWAFNASHHDSFVEAAKELEDLRTRWSEHVDDATYAPLDDRVGADSIAMHGQAVPAGVSFTMPRDPDVDTKMWGKQWLFPPNRPNDRAILAPWRPGWGVPAWEMRGGRQVDL